MFVLTDSRSVYVNKWINVREDRVIRPDGEPGIFGVVSMSDGSTVVPLDASGEVTLVTEYKYSLGRDSLEAVSGAIDAGESPLDCARRELAEELGLEAGVWTHLGAVDPFTSVVRSANHMFLAEELTPGQASPDPGEILAPVKVPLKVALEMVLTGKITHAASCISILKIDMLLAARALA